MKKILFIVTGFGYGDSIRVHSIINKILQKTPKTKILILGYDTSFNYFENKFKTLKIHGYKFIDENLRFNPFIFTLRNIYLPLSWKISYLKNKAKVKEFDPDVIVSDFEPVAHFFAKHLKKPVISIFGFNPKTYQDYPHKTSLLTAQAKFLEHYYKKSKLILIPSFFKQKKIKSDYTLINPVVRTTPHLLPDESKLMKKLKLTKSPILIMLGGSNFGYKLAKEIFHFLRNKEELVIFGGKKQIPGYHYTSFQPNFLEYLKVAKGIITLAGHITLSECLVFKKPMLIFPIKNHVEQLMNAYSLRNIATIGNSNDIKASLKRFFANLKDQQKKLNKLEIESNGAQQAATKVLSF